MRRHFTRGEYTSDAGPAGMLGIFRMTDSLIFDAAHVGFDAAHVGFDAGQRRRGEADYE
jgi:hypothetical protein